MNSSHGAALITALMMLFLLAALGGALLSSITLDVWIGDNHRSAMQSLYLAEAGIEEAREALRTSTSRLSQLLAVASGPDRVISTSRDLQALLDSTDDDAFVR